MAKASRKHPLKSSTGRAAPYPAKQSQKARVEVTYDGPRPAPPPGRAPQPGPSTSQAPPIQVESVTEVKKETSPVVELSAKAKGKARAVENVPAEVPTGHGLGLEHGTFMIVAGSYEKLLYGLEGAINTNRANQGGRAGALGAALKPVFIFPAHLACVKAIAASPGGKWLATGSEDEFIKVWDLRRRKEVGSLSQHSGTITSLHFPSSSHLLSTSVDGTIALFRTSDWACLKSLKGHSGRVNHVDVHPTGRVALSVGKDCTLKMWDLMRGRGASSLALGSEAELVRFSPHGTHFAVLFPKKIEIYSLTLKLLRKLETKSRFNCLEFAVLSSGSSDSSTDVTEIEVLCVGTEKGVVEVHSIEIGRSGGQGKESEEEENEDEDEADGAEGSENDGRGADVRLVGTLKGHTNRIKSLSTLRVPTPDAGFSTLLATASSDGFINVYNLDAVRPNAGLQELPVAMQPSGSYDTKGSRLTCVFLADGKKPQPGATARASVNGSSAHQPSQGTRDGQDEEVDGEDDVEDDDDDDDDDMYASGEEDEDEDAVDVEFEDEDELEEEDVDAEEEEEGDADD